jgi:hypothetical protein
VQKQEKEKEKEKKEEKEKEIRTWNLACELNIF